MTLKERNKTTFLFNYLSFICVLLSVALLWQELCVFDCIYTFRWCVFRMTSSPSLLAALWTHTTNVQTVANGTHFTATHTQLIIIQRQSTILCCVLSTSFRGKAMPTQVKPKMSRIANRDFNWNWYRDRHQLTTANVWCAWSIHTLLEMRIHVY